jgi:hypothetical protein
MTSSQGLVNLVIGSGVVQSGVFAAINWGTGPYFVSLGVDFTNGTAYQDFGTQQLMSVPFALYAKTAGNQLNQWRYGNGAPATTLGAFGDFYLDVQNGNVYYKNTGSSWVLTGNITGPQGAVGATGPAGATGPQGPQGATGPQGLTGPAGPQGPQGIQGATGATGATGAQGPAGVAGPQGPAGTNGNTILSGTSNPTAGIGVNGDYYMNTATNTFFGPKANGTWPAGFSMVGPQGAQGVQGTTGPQGPIGATGPAGATGPQGPIGLTGPAGATGATGPQGPIGLTGPAGATGAQGPQGIQGVAGTNGLNALIKTTAEPAGSNCTNGGTKIETGLDANSNGTLDASEVNASQTQYVCNGASGSSSFSNGTIQGEMLFWNGSSWTTIPPGQTGQNLTFCYNAPQWGPCLAQISTTTVSNITGLIATSGGIITNDGGSAITSKGICWDINQNPDLNDNFSSDGTGTGSFTSSLNNLIPNTTYYVRAYATNAGGTVYGNQQTFLSGAALPTVVTGTVTNISYNTASVSGNVTSDGGATVTQRGICYSTSQNPTIANSVVVTGSGVGNYTSNLTGFNGNTTYYVRAFATNSTGTSYGSQISFTTLLSPSPLSCSGGTFYGYVTSPQMNAQGIIVAQVGQQITIKHTATGNQFCNCSSFSNSSSAVVINAFCEQWASPNYIQEIIVFNTPGVYNMSSQVSDCIMSYPCSYSIVINP